MAIRPRCATHQIALSDGGRCLLCDRGSPGSAAPSSTRRASSRTALLLLGLTLILIAAAALGLFQRFGWVQGEGLSRPVQPSANEPRLQTSSEDLDPEALREAPNEGALTAVNRSGRRGYFYFPKASGRPIRMLVLFHGQGGSGAGIAPLFRSLAEARSFAIVAPDSGFVPEAGALTWYAKSKPDETSPDAPHILASIEELIARARMARPAISLTSGGWLAAGHSAGASSAAALATNDGRFSHFAVLHGGTFPGGFGDFRPEGWFSTGENDSMRTPEHVRMQARAAARVIGETYVRVTIFPGGHEVGAEESQAVIDFWLSGS